MDDDFDPVPCVCEDCGKKFNKGDEGDNEKVCLRCDARFCAEKDYDFENGHMDEDNEEQSEFFGRAFIDDRDIN